MNNWKQKKEEGEFSLYETVSSRVLYLTKKGEISMKRKRIGTAAVSILVILLLGSHVMGEVKTTKKYAGTTVHLLYTALKYDQIGIEMSKPEFEQKYGIKLVIEYCPYPEMRGKSLMELSKRTGRYDLVGQDCMWMAEFVAPGYLEPLMQYFKDPELCDPVAYDIDDFVPRILAGHGVWKDVLYSIPFSPGAIIYELRRDVFLEAGLEYPQTWDDLEIVLPKVHKPEEKFYGYVGQAARGVPINQMFLSFWDGCGGHIFDPGWKPAIDTPEMVKAGEFMLSLKSYMPPGVEAFGWDEMMATFNQGYGAVTPMFSPFCMASENPETSTIVGKVDYRPVAVGPIGKPNGFFGAWGIGIPSDSKNKEAAFLWLQYVSSKEFQRRWVLAGGVPTRTSAFVDPEIRKKWGWMDVAHYFMMYQALPDFRPSLPEWAEIDDIMGTEIFRAWMGEITVAQAMKNSQQKTEALMERVGYYEPGAEVPPQQWLIPHYYDRKPSSWE